MVNFDTESCGYFGPTIMIQYQFDDGPIELHNIFTNNVESTLGLIERMCDTEVMGFNLTHDWFHLCRTYNILKELPVGSPPDIIEYRDAEKEDTGKYCLKPKDALDLLVYAKKTRFQSAMRQKDIVIRKVPKQLAPRLVQHLQTIDIPEIYFSRTGTGYKWRIDEINDKGRTAKEGDIIDKQFANIRLKFNPSVALKAIIKEIRRNSNSDSVQGVVDSYGDLPELPKVEEYEYNPRYGAWILVIREYINAYTYDTRRLTYARNDVVYNRDVYDYLGSPVVSDSDSVLACAIGAMYWRGATLSVPLIGRQREEVKVSLESNPITKIININSPAQVVNYLKSVATPLEALAVTGSSKEVMATLVELPSLALPVTQIIKARADSKKLELYNKLMLGKLHVMYKIVGTKSNRSSGGSEDYITSKGSVNPQGIQKGSSIRKCFTFRHEGEESSGGDFDSFEVGIAEAVYQDEGLRSELRLGKKIHALFGSAMYNMTYEAVLATSEIGHNDPNGFYSRAKTGFFASLYGAEAYKLSQSMWLEEDECREGLDRFKARYPGIAKAKERIAKAHSAMVQSEGEGTAIIWNEPKLYAESLLGFRRYFTLEYGIIRKLFELASDLPGELKAPGVIVTRRDRIQTGGGAVRSALYGAAFGLQAGILRQVGNHEIQSTGGEITKNLQGKIWEKQPCGIGQWKVMVFNFHDELQVTTIPELTLAVRDMVNEYVASMKSLIPFIGMTWKVNINDWSEK